MEGRLKRAAFLFLDKEGESRVVDLRSSTFSMPCAGGATFWLGRPKK